MSTIERNRRAAPAARPSTEQTVERARSTGSTPTNTVRDGAPGGGNRFADGFENRAAAGTAAAQRIAPRGSQPDRVFDGQFVGAGRRTFPPNTPLSQIPGVTPRNNPNPTQTILYVNGINTTKDAQFDSLQNIANRTGARVVGIHNATEGMAADLAQCVKDKLDVGRNPAVDTLANTLYTELKAGRSVHLMAHSQGGLVSSRALNDVYRRLRVEDGMSRADTERLMSRINVETFGAAAGHYPNGPTYVHYINQDDPVPTLFGLGGKIDRWNPTLDAGRGAVVHHFNENHLNPITSHSFDSVYLNHRVPFDQARANRF